MSEIPRMERLSEKIAEAAARLEGLVLRTPLLESAVLNERLGLRLLVKAESVQKTGSFKVRGALNFLSLASAHQASRFVGFSSGNHAQGLAYAARTFGSHATVLMPADAPERKIAATTALGARVELLEDFFGLRRDRVEKLVSEGSVFVPPFDHEAIIAGQGTVGREASEQLAALSATPDVLICPISGGGLFAGAASAVKGFSPACELLAVEPLGFNDFAKSVEAGALLSNTSGGATICDGLKSPQPGHLPFETVKALQPSFAVVSDDQCESAMRTLFESFNLVAEPSGAASIAALLASAEQFKGKTVLAIVSGGNVDPRLFARVLNTH